MSTETAEAPGSADVLDGVFHALSDRTRRAILVRLADRPATVGDLAAPFAMSLPAVSKHLKVLERARLVSRTIDGRRHQCTLEPLAFHAADDWIAPYRRFWGEQFEALDRLLGTRHAALARRKVPIRKRRSVAPPTRRTTRGASGPTP
jgi:DNA-binding transcriptional ArsR family regulator